MTKMNGVEASRKVFCLFKIKDLVKNNNYTDAFLVAHTSDDSKYI